jgi:hypothetical protein
VRSQPIGRLTAPTRRGASHAAVPLVSALIVSDLAYTLSDGGQSIGRHLTDLGALAALQGARRSDLVQEIPRSAPNTSVASDSPGTFRRGRLVHGRACLTLIASRPCLTRRRHPGGKTLTKGGKSAGRPDRLMGADPPANRAPSSNAGKRRHRRWASITFSGDVECDIMLP